MEKQMLAIGKFKEGEDHLEKFMKFFQSDEGMEMRKSVAHVEKTIAGILPDKSGIMFKVHVHNEQGMKDLVSGRHPVMKPIYDEHLDHIKLYELTEVNIEN
tara:strand:- start:595 stop:897 length:303 start_codon:yes stop_codon:yes gene_type:complete